MNGEALKEIGQEQVLASNAEWKDQIYVVMKEQQGDFTSEDIREEARQRSIPAPRHPNAWGAVFTAANRLGIIAKTGERCKSRLPRSHAAGLDVWRTCETVEPAMSLAL